MGTKFSIEISVDGYPPDGAPPAVDVDIKFPSALKNLAQNWMIKNVVDRTRAGRDIHGNPFAPLAGSGDPTNLTGTGAMLNGVRPAKGSDLQSRGYIAAVGITCDPGAGERYPWIVNAGVNPEGYKAKRIEVVDRMIARKEARLARKNAQAASITNRLTKKWDDLQRTIEAIQGDLRELRKRRADIEAKKIKPQPPREWWGLDDSEREKVNGALSAWVRAVVSGVVGVACHPLKTNTAQVYAEADAAFRTAFSGGPAAVIEENE